MADAFSKTDKQREAIDLLSSEQKYAALFGGSRSGKTFIICYALLVRAAKTKSRHAILRKNFNAAKRTIWLDTMPKVINLCFPNLGVIPNKTDYYFELPNGSQIFIGGLDDKERAEKILGQEFSTIYFNECSQIDYSSVQIALTRLAEKNSLKKRIYYDFNPPNKSHWSYHLFIKKLDPLSDEPLINTMDYGSLLMNPKDNLANIDEGYIKMLEAMPEKERNRFLDGLFNDESQGQVYYAFRRDHHVKNIERKTGTLWCGMDFNVDPMTAVIFQYYDNTFHAIDEVFLNNSDTFKMTDELKRRGYAGLRIIPDSTGRNRKTSGKSDFEIINAAGFVVESTYNPFITDRINNVNRIMTANRLLISPKCKKLINDLEKVVWKDNKPDQHGEAKHLTHISDALGYGLHKLDPLGLSQVQFTSNKR